MLDGTTAFVTGASQGIGREIAVTLAREGANVALAARSDGIEETAAQIDDPERVLTVRCDVTDEGSVEDAVGATVDRFGGVDCVVNNAGIAGPTKPIEEVEREEWDRTMAVNVTGMYLVAKHTAPHLRESDRGRMVNVSSISGKRPLESRTPYTASKMAVIGLTRTLAFELGDDGVTVNAVCPGATRGPRIDDIIERQADQLGVDYETAKAEVFTDDTALGRLVDASDVAEMVAYLASDAARHVTAQDVNVDGGTVWY
ncbi:SDR family NAD(P)-dependent oxidoreductase [Halogeometricum limi]|uniref:NAD(P)-dependent dehydrogenase, short-chain alcohol dehydrogenase family n=1 Tax=Halogeometricum limi TaxID=555875 RepID=A0A1I6IC89_9EURY|nr:SDR family NAD(P)-dependent oxidoreductase [Halogeometricum limi]SFR64234.1 NAD(P)-dependent dehydrogenase, short-chain alcohol dehydrogenase family [Halogeometricum limi]